MSCASGIRVLMHVWVWWRCRERRGRVWVVKPAAWLTGWETLIYTVYIHTHADTHIWREGLLFQCQLWTTRSSIQGLWPWTQYKHISSEVVGFSLVYVLNLNNVLKDVVKKVRINDQINEVASFRTLCIKDWVFLSRASFFKILY